MIIHTNVPLRNYTTMQLGGNARFFTDVTTPEEVAEVCRNVKKQHVDLPIFVLGSGSNVIVRDNGFNGLILRMQIKGVEVVANDSGYMTLKVGAGENWDQLVEKSIEMGLSGIEAMSGIPGTIGATPVQNVGAYGQEIADVLQSLEAYDQQNDKFVTITNLECGFSYRNSIFKETQAGRYIITSLVIKLSKDSPKPPFYDSLQKYLDENNIKIFTSQIIRNTVLKLRKSKLPDPKMLPNSGSFFKNVIVESWQADNIKNIDQNIPMFDMGGGQYKIPSGWLIEHSGLSGQLLHGMRVFDKNALVLVNESAHDYQDLSLARDEIIDKVRTKYDVQLEQEPVEI